MEMVAPKIEDILAGWSERTTAKQHITGHQDPPTAPRGGLRGGLTPVRNDLLEKRRREAEVVITQAQSWSRWLSPVTNRHISSARRSRAMLAQTYSHFEIVVMDDGSADKPQRWPPAPERTLHLPGQRRTF